MPFEFLQDGRASVGLLVQHNRFRSTVCSSRRISSCLCASSRPCTTKIGPVASKLVTTSASPGSSWRSNW